MEDRTSTLSPPPLSLSPPPPPPPPLLLLKRVRCFFVHLVDGVHVSITRTHAFLKCFSVFFSSMPVGYLGNGTPVCMRKAVNEAVFLHLSTANANGFKLSAQEL